jgi:AbrB family looped-hinge helix DNA binding protein
MTETGPARTTLKQRGVITIPARIRDALHLEEGDPIEVEIIEDGILLRPMKLVDASQAWFWTREWQAGERRADEEYATGKGRIFINEEEFFAHLDELDRAADRKGSPRARR